jgi:hypothetical protein
LTTTRSIQLDDRYSWEALILGGREASEKFGAKIDIRHAGVTLQTGQETRVGRLIGEGDQERTGLSWNPLNDGKVEEKK